MEGGDAVTSVMSLGCDSEGQTFRPGGSVAVLRFTCVRITWAGGYYADCQVQPRKSPES